MNLDLVATAKATATIALSVKRTLHILCAFRCVSVAQLNMVRIWCECVIAGTIVFRKNCIACTQKSASKRILYAQPIWCCCLSSVNIHVEPVIYLFFFSFCWLVKNVYPNQWRFFIFIWIAWAALVHLNRCQNGDSVFFFAEEGTYSGVCYMCYAVVAK